MSVCVCWFVESVGRLYPVETEAAFLVISSAKKKRKEKMNKNITPPPPPPPPPPKKKKKKKRKKKHSTIRILSEIKGKGVERMTSIHWSSSEKSKNFTYHFDKYERYHRANGNIWDSSGMLLRKRFFVLR